MLRAWRFLATPFLALCLAAPAAAAPYRPDIALFDGTNGMAYPADYSLNLSAGGTIEFYVAPKWTTAPAYDPVILSNAGEKGASYMVVLLRDRDGIGIRAGDQTALAPFDFTDGKLHHVALICYADKTTVLVDGVVVAQPAIAFADLPSSGFFIGSADGDTAPMVGAIGGVRIWNIPVSPDDLRTYAMQDLVDDQGAAHPDIQSLVGISQFQTRSFALLSPEPLVAADDGAAAVEPLPQEVSQ